VPSPVEAAEGARLEFLEVGSAQDRHWLAQGATYRELFSTVCGGRLEPSSCSGCILVFLGVVAPLRTPSGDGAWRGTQPIAAADQGRFGMGKRGDGRPDGKLHYLRRFDGNDDNRQGCLRIW